MSEKILEQILVEIKEMKQEVSGTKQEVSGIKQEQKITNERLTKLESKQTFIHEQTVHLSEYYTEIQSRFDNLATKDDLAYIDTQIGKHDRELFKIKNRV